MVSSVLFGPLLPFQQEIRLVKTCHVNYIKSVFCFFLPVLFIHI